MRTGIRLTSAIIVSLLLNVNLYAATYGGGSGTSESPLEIWTAQQMNTIGLNSADWGASFKLMADIDMTGVSYNIIGNYPNSFTGTFDGNGHVISNLTIQAPSQYYVGLFGYIGEGGQICNLGVENVNILGNSIVGGLVGQNFFGTLTACYATGTVSGTDTVGGLVGGNHLGTLTSCYAVDTVISSGGAGGLVGYNFYGTVTACYTAGAVSGSSVVGGLVSNNYGGILTSCYAAGAVSGDFYLGGLMGANSSGTLTACFWDTVTSGQSLGAGYGDSIGSTGKTTAEMQTLSTFTDAGWDFSATDGDPADWCYPHHDYPKLAWQASGVGSGTVDNPWQIHTPQQMNTVGLYPQDWASHFILMADIDMSAYTGTQYNIIGNSTAYFTGTFDGNGHVISNLTIDAPSRFYVGLFSYVGTGGQVRNLGLENVTIHGQIYVGGLVGLNLGTITTCHIAGMVGGLSDVGGLVGYNSYGTISSCYAAGTVSGGIRVGGLVGNDSCGIIETSYLSGTVSGSSHVGGVVGNCENGFVAYCYTAGTVSGSNAIGGLVGYNADYMLVSCYAAGTVSGSNAVGGLVGLNVPGSTASDCFWDTQTSGLNQGVGFGNTLGVTGKTTAQMKTRSTFTSAGWDFTNETANGTSDFWHMCADGINYPKLSWQTLKGDLSCPEGVAIDDFSALAAQWLRAPCAAYNNFCGRADMDFSSSVDTADLLIFAANWLKN